MSTSAVLREMRAFLDDPSHWVQGHYWLDAEGNDVEVAQAVACCLSGASTKAVYDLSSIWENEAEADRRVRQAVQEGTEFTNTISFNDDSETTHQQVLAVLDRAIELEEGE
jgi:hypothetical protein